MKMVIEISEKTYEEVMKIDNSLSEIVNAIRYGTPLPKGHGRLIDADALLQEHRDLDAYPFPSTTIQNAPTIIEADKESDAE